MKGSYSLYLLVLLIVAATSSIHTFSIPLQDEVRRDTYKIIEADNQQEQEGLQEREQHKVTIP